MIDRGTVLANQESLYGVRMIDDGTWDRSCFFCHGWPSCFALCDRSSFVASLSQVVEVLCLRDRSWLRCHGWQWFRCVIYTIHASM